MLKDFYFHKPTGWDLFKMALFNFKNFILFNIFIEVII